MGAKLAFNEEEEIALLRAHTRFLLVESFRLDAGLNCSHV